MAVVFFLQNLNHKVSDLIIQAEYKCYFVNSNKKEIGPSTIEGIGRWDEWCCGGGWRVARGGGGDL